MGDSVCSDESIIEPCKYCGDDVEVLEPGHYKSPGEKFAHEECIAEQCYDSRKKVATDEGVFMIEPVRITKVVGEQDEILDTFWQAECPQCFETHETTDQSEKAREPLVSEVLGCCGAEWLPPEDYLDECSVCGESHREQNDCVPLYRREPMPKVTTTFECTECDWTGDGRAVNDVGACPDCDSYALQTVETND